MVWIVDAFARRANQINCGDLIYQAHGCIDDWISLDLGIQVPEENMRVRIMRERIPQRD